MRLTTAKKKQNQNDHDKYLSNPETNRYLPSHTQTIRAPLGPSGPGPSYIKTSTWEWERWVNRRQGIHGLKCCRLWATPMHHNIHQKTITAVSICHRIPVCVLHIQYLHRCCGFARIIDANFTVLTNCGQELPIWAPCHPKHLKHHEPEEGARDLKHEQVILSFQCVWSKHIFMSKLLGKSLVLLLQTWLSLISSCIYLCLGNPPGPGVQWALWPPLLFPGSTVWLWDHRTKTPGLHWPEGETWLSKSSLCGLWGNPWFSCHNASFHWTLKWRK